MISYKFFTLSLILSVFFAPLSFASQQRHEHSIEFFASNNTGEIDLQTAFNRLKGDEQLALQNEIISLMQKEHIEQGKSENLLGTYKMSVDQNITADNSEIFITSSYQKISADKAFHLAKKLANSLKQDSVAVFVPVKQPIIGDTILTFKSHQYTINDIVKIIHEKLPANYSQAFSLHLGNTCSSFDNAAVKQVEWLGSNINPEDIQKSFPQDDVSYQYGKAYLVYKNGQKEQL